MFSTKAPRRVQLPGAEGKPGAVTFLVKVVSLDERDLFEAELAGPPWNAGLVYEFQFLDALEEAARAWLDGDHLATVEAALQQRRAGRKLDTAQQAILLTLEEEARRNWPGFQLLERRRQNRHLLAPALALRRFLQGWEGFDQPFDLGADGYVNDATLERLTQLERLLVGRVILRGLHLTADEGNGSASPTKSSAGLATSRAAGGRRTAGRAGKSASSSTRKTPR